MADIKKIGVMTCGGDCPGLNAVVRAVTLTAIRHYGWKVLGIEDSMQGLINLDYRSPNGNIELTESVVEDILSKGGTILGCDNHSDPFKFAIHDEHTGKKTEIDVSDKVLANFKALGLDALVMIGGDGTMGIANRLSAKGHFPVVGVPKTIDNDLGATDYTFGFDTAIGTISEAIDKIQDTARSHDRALVVEVMGRDAGWLALHGGMAGGAHVILIPEIPYDVETILAKIHEREKKGHPFTIIVIAEGAKPSGGSLSFAGERKAGEMARYGGAGQQLEACLRAAKFRGADDVRVSVLGYIQRGGSPSAFDRILGTRFGEFAAHLVAQKKFAHMASLKTPEIVAVPFEEACKTQKRVDPNGQLVQSAKTLGICMGNK